MMPTVSPRLIGEPRPDSLPSSERDFGEAHRDAGADRGGKPDQERLPGVVVAKAAAKIGASVDTDPSISPASPGCT